MSVGPRPSNRKGNHFLLSEFVAIDPEKEGGLRLRHCDSPPFLVGIIWVVIGTNGLNCAWLIWFDSDSGHVQKKAKQIFP